MNTICKTLIVLTCLKPLLTFAAGMPSVSELLDRYAESQEKLSSFIAETQCSECLKIKNEDTPVYYRQFAKVYIDGEKYHFKKRWSKFTSKDATKPVKEEKIYHNLWDGNRNMMYKVGSHADIDRNEESAKSLLDVTIVGVPFLVRTSAFERLDIVLRQAKTISVRDELEQVGSENCYVIDAKTASGAYTVWIDPQHDYHIAQAEIRVGPGEKYRSRMLSDGEKCLFSIRNIRFEKIDGIWIPIETDTHYENVSPNPEFCWTNDTNNKMTKITLNPDHEALGSFVPDIENGITVIDRDYDIKYTWQDGKLIPDVDEVVIEQLDKTTQEILKEKSVPSGLGSVEKAEILDGEPNTIEDTPPATTESQSNVLLESRSYSTIVLISIIVLILGVIGWQVLIRFKT